MIAPQSIETMSPSSSTPVAGDAVHDHLVGRRADHGGEAVIAEEVRLGAPALEDLRAAVSRSAVRAPGRAARIHTSCISATTVPARRISAIWSGTSRVITPARIESFDLADDALEHEIARAHTVDDPHPLPDGAVVVEDRHRVGLVEPRASARRPPRCRRRAARPGHRRCRRSTASSAAC